jgi:hypothetical protein
VGKLDGSDNRSQEYIPITDFFNTHAWLRQLPRACLGAFRSSLAAGKDGLFECATYRGKFMRRTRAWKRGSERKSSQPGYLFV